MAAAGTNYLLKRNEWINNPGAPGVGGYGVLLYYVPSGQYSSENFPISNVLIKGDRFTSNGRITAGSGILVDSGNIANADVMRNIVITNSIFENNSNMAIHASSAKHTENLRAFNNKFAGTNQTINISPNYAAGAVKMLDRSDRWTGCFVHD